MNERISGGGSDAVFLKHIGGYNFMGKRFVLLKGGDLRRREVWWFVDEFPAVLLLL